jgi:hypothetical protein
VRPIFSAGTSPVTVRIFFIEVPHTMHVPKINAILNRSSR